MNIPHSSNLHPLSESSNESFYFSNAEDVYISIALLKTDLIDFLIEWDLTNKNYKTMRPIEKSFESRNRELLNILKSISENIEIKGVIFFSDFWETDLPLCKTMNSLKLEYFIFSKDGNMNKFDEIGKPLIMQENFILYPQQESEKHFSRIELLIDNFIFEGFNFIVEVSQRKKNFTKDDKKEMSSRYRSLKMFLGDFEETINSLKKTPLFYNNFPIQFYDKCVTIHQQFLLYQKEKNCSFDYYYQIFFQDEFSRN